MSSEENADGKKTNEESQESPRKSGMPEELMNTVGASPPKFVNFEQLMSAADGMKNMCLAHEIAVNNDFQLMDDASPENNLHKHVRDIMHQAFWDLFEEKLNEEPPDLSMALTVIEELKEMIISLLLPKQQAWRDQVNQVLDLDLLKQKMEHDAFDVDYYSNYITDILAKFCAPVRDESIAQIRNTSGMVPKFRAIRETLEMMKMDMVNFTIRNARPFIQQHTVDYERKKVLEIFEAQTAAGLDPMNYSRLWLRRNFDKLLKASTDAQSATASNASCIPTPANVMIESYLEILEWSDPHNFPETLILDHPRFMALRDKLHSLALMSSIQLVTFGIVGPSVEGVESLKGTMKEHVEILLNDVATEGIKSVLESIGLQMSKDVEESLSSRGFPVLSDDQKNNIKTQVSSLGSRDNKVRKLMFQRLMGFIREGMSNQAINNIRVPKGCTAVHQELSEVLRNFLHLTSHNRAVYGPHYAPIIERLMKPETDENADPSQANGVPASDQ